MRMKRTKDARFAVWQRFGALLSDLGKPAGSHKAIEELLGVQLIAPRSMGTVSSRASPAYWRELPPSPRRCVVQLDGPDGGGAAVR